MPVEPEVPSTSVPPGPAGAGQPVSGPLRQAAGEPASQAGTESAGGLRLLHHPPGDAVLVAAAGVEELCLPEDLAPGRLLAPHPAVP